MKTFSKTIFIISILFNVTFSQFKILGYFPNWTSKEKIESYNFSRLTHVNAAFLVCNASGEVYYESTEAEEAMDMILEKAKAQGVIVLVSVWGNHEMLLNETSRTNFANNIKAHCLEKGYAGVDLDFEGEYDESGLSLLATKLREIFGDDLFISAAVSGVANDQGYNVELVNACDWINPMIYDIAGSWNSSPIANHSSYENFTDAAYGWHYRRGIEKDRIILGVPFYGRTFNDEGKMRVWGVQSWSNNCIIYSAIAKFFPENLKTDTTAGDFYMTIADLKLTQSELVEFNQEVMGDWSGDPVSEEEMLGKTYYNGKKMIASKTKYAVDNSYGGIMIWDLSQDMNDEHSLLDTIYYEAYGKYPVRNITRTNANDNNVKVDIKDNVLFLSNLSLGEKYTLSIYALNGQRLLTKGFVGARFISSSLFLKDLNHSKSLYVLQLSSSGGQEIRKFVKQ